jgi:alanine dehydrogenase
MIVGVPKEIKDNEYRVAMTPGGARQLVNLFKLLMREHGAS